MGNINLKNFVDINIQPHETGEVIATRDTVLLFTMEDFGSTEKEILSIDDPIIDNLTYTKNYIEMFFNNNGVKVKLVKISTYLDLTVDYIKSLDNKYIYLALADEDLNVAVAYNTMKALAQNLNSDNTIYGINEKIILARTTAKTNEDIDKDLVKNFVVKYSTELGAEMTMAAYLSQMNLEESDVVKDYMFTQENIAASNITDDEYKLLQSYNINVNIDLSGNIRNCGGNCKDGEDFVNNFVRIVLHQTLTDRLITLLSQKIKSTDGTSKIYAVIAQELEKYKTAGYLTTDKVWTDRTLKVVKNQITYTIIEQGDAITNGYVIKVLPMGALTEQEKQNRNAPPIYVIVADQYGIRKITIKGDVI